jgi:NADH dehydrogenase
VTKDKKRVLILGAGFGGLYTALHLEGSLKRDAPVEITLVDRNHFHLFTPLLHEAASGVIHPSLIMTPIRRILRGKRVSFLRARVDGIDLRSQGVIDEQISYNSIHRQTMGPPLAGSAGSLRRPCVFRA